MYTMPPAPFTPTAFEDVNAVLAELSAGVQSILGDYLVGIYLTGSLALGDFDPDASDIDLIVVSAAPLAETQVVALAAMHMHFDAGVSRWAGEVEAVYVSRKALRRMPPDATCYPQVEKERGFFVDRLEDGWLVQCYILRRHGVAITGPAPETLVPPVDADALRQTVAAIPEMWRNEAHNDPSWMEWLRVRRNQSFVVLTLCRLLYTLEAGKVSSKPAAARWAQQRLDERWAALIEGALAGKADNSPTPDADVAATVALVELVAARFDL